MEKDFHTLYNELFHGGSGKSPEELQKLFQETLAALPPDMFYRHFENMTEMARQSGNDNMREEIVCRLLASGMTAQEIAVTLCVREAEIQIIESNNTRAKIPEYAKKLKERRKRRNKSAEKITP